METDYRTEREDVLYNNLLAFVLAVGATLGVYVVLAVVQGAPPLLGFLGRVPDAELPWLAAVLLSRGPLQPLNFCLFAFGAFLLGISLWNMRREFRAFREPFFS